MSLVSRCVRAVMCRQDLRVRTDLYNCPPMTQQLIADMGHEGAGAELQTGNFIRHMFSTYIIIIALPQQIQSINIIKKLLAEVPMKKRFKYGQGGGRDSIFRE